MLLGDLPSGEQVGGGCRLGAQSRLRRAEGGVGGSSLWHGGWIPRTSVPRKPGGSCMAFYDLALEIT